MFTGQITAEAVIVGMLTGTTESLKKYTRPGTIFVMDEGLAWDMRKGLRNVRSTAGWDRLIGFMRQGQTAKMLLDGSEDGAPFNTTMIALTFVSPQAADLDAAFRNHVTTGWKTDITMDNGLHWDSMWERPRQEVEW